MRKGKITFVTTFFALAISAFAQTDNPVLMEVNGKKITKFTTDKKKTTKTFKVTYKATKTGKKIVKVYTYNTAGYASNAKSKTVTVKRK